jgi:hypothetical protein
MVGTISGVTFNQRGVDYDIQLVRGATVSFGLVWGGQNSPIDVTGFTANLQVKVNASDASPSFEFKNANSRVTIGSTDGLITFSMTAADSAALTLGNYVYALEVVDATGKNIQVMSGKLKVIQGVT